MEYLYFKFTNNNVQINTKLQLVTMLDHIVKTLMPN